MRGIVRFLLFFLLLGSSADLALADALRLEAEDAELVGTAVSSSGSGFSGTGYVNGFTDGEDRVSFAFEASEGVYDLVIGFRTPNGEKGFNAALNGVGFSGMFEATGSFSRFDVGTVLLAEGVNRLWIGGGWSYYEIDYVELLEASPPEPPLWVEPVPVDGEASVEARALLRYLSSGYGKATLSGQQDVGELDVVEALTGVRPAILGGDLIEYSPSRIEYGSNPNQHTESLIEQYEEGMLITLAWHWNAPVDLVLTQENPWWRGFYTEGTTFNFAEALDNPDGEDYRLLLRDIDVIAVELKKLQAAKVPVLWRPLHESDGGWFWWGTQGADNLRRLWVLLYERLTEHHGIHNLIWVQTIEDLDWYAGDEYVDILGIDSYPQDYRDPLTSIWKEFLDRFDGKKLISLSEFGRVPDVETMHKLGVWFSYFMSWNGELGAGGMPEDGHLQQIYTSSAVVTKAEVDLDGDGLVFSEEAEFGSSVYEADSNGDGIEDGRAYRLGFGSTADLAGVYRFYTDALRYVCLRQVSSDAVLVQRLSLDLSLDSLDTHELIVETSSDLELWTRLPFSPEMFNGRGGELACLELPFVGAQVFVRVRLVELE